MELGSGLFAGLAVVGFCIYYGLEKIADAIRYRHADINFKDVIKIVHGTWEDFEKAGEPLGGQRPAP